MNSCGKVILRCEYTNLSENTILIKIVGVHPRLLDCNSIPSSSVTFTGSTAIVNLPTRSECTSLLYESCVYGEKVTVVQLLLSEPKSQLSVKTTATPALTTIPTDENAVITFRNCITNTSGFAPITSIISALPAIVLPLFLLTFRLVTLSMLISVLENTSTRVLLIYYKQAKLNAWTSG